MSTPLLPEVIPETDTNPGVGSVMVWSFVTSLTLTIHFRTLSSKRIFWNLQYWASTWTVCIMTYLLYTCVRDVFHSKRLALYKQCAHLLLVLLGIMAYHKRCNSFFLSCQVTYQVRRHLFQRIHVRPSGHADGPIVHKEAHRISSHNINFLLMSMPSWTIRSFF